ncbi:hypothetical protein SAMD00020551_0859 [Mesobacillus selenatarsenatis SF-1]|uniref:Uncharacterized protein n=1 Tax=Mesobacillus selenatarsenatis (strain DSM 18680 / JCM 14380 / FERM P-15431 / SF-1) TaxID=1321606 RepID=A0A0A8X0E8_MESS1|nr:hypothetical protein SAMD00020551_0859 [Mesobacillus selenatarsenatis SF-1]
MKAEKLSRKVRNRFGSGSRKSVNKIIFFQVLKPIINLHTRWM